MAYSVQRGRQQLPRGVGVRPAAAAIAAATQPLSAAAEPAAAVTAAAVPLAATAEPAATVASAAVSAVSTVFTAQPATA